MHQHGSWRGRPVGFRQCSALNGAHLAERWSSSQPAPAGSGRPRAHQPQRPAGQPCSAALARQNGPRRPRCPFANV